MYSFEIHCNISDKHTITLFILAFRSQTYDYYEEMVGKAMERYTKNDMEERHNERWSALGVD